MGGGINGGEVFARNTVRSCSENWLQSSRTIGEIILYYHIMIVISNFGKKIFYKSITRFFITQIISNLKIKTP